MIELKDQRAAERLSVVIDLCEEWLVLPDYGRSANSRVRLVAWCARCELAPPQRTRVRQLIVESAQHENATRKAQRWADHSSP